jgi:hypothetical protein
LKHCVFFLRAGAIGEKELLAKLQCLSLYCRGSKPIPYRSQESISVPLIFCRVPIVTTSANEAHRLRRRGQRPQLQYLKPFVFRGDDPTSRLRRRKQAGVIGGCRTGLKTSNFTLHT